MPQNRQPYITTIGELHDAPSSFYLASAGGPRAGWLIGAERQLRQRLAGLRTNALVAAGSALFVLVTAFSDDREASARIAAQVVSGIGSRRRRDHAEG